MHIRRRCVRILSKHENQYDCQSISGLQRRFPQPCYFHSYSSSVNHDDVWTTLLVKYKEKNQERTLDPKKLFLIQRYIRDNIVKYKENLVYAKE